ncbi:MAG: phosphoribosylamine--glycine ligase [Gammaproteobacteria bacterium]|nr:phosphoribosylamine--glycine ligase [Gammaproteobacteria bacterium]
MRVLVIGGGGREHALAWRIASEERVEQVFVAPGNAGTAGEPGVENVTISADDIHGLVDFARSKNIDLTVVGPEGPLVAGICDRFGAEGLACFGPSAAAARLEGSKAFSKDFLARHNIPTAAYRVFKDNDSAQRWISTQKGPLVVKADGLAAGKGVIIARNSAEAGAAAEDMLGEGRFGKAGRQIVVEEFLVGEEASFIAMVDGKNVLPLASSQDHKARDEGDKGPNTGGMGAYSPAPVVSPAVHARIMNEIMLPTVRGLASENSPYVGFLYAGVMIAEDGSVKVLEFNCRFGDPETQPIMMRLRSPLTRLCESALAGTLDKQKVEWDPRAALGVVMAAKGYPSGYASGDVISGLPTASSDLKVFHAGTVLKDGRILTSGGRVLCVVGLGTDVSHAAATAYGAVRGIKWENSFFRRDIGHRAIAREQLIEA